MASLGIYIEPFDLCNTSLKSCRSVIQQQYAVNIRGHETTPECHQSLCLGLDWSSCFDEWVNQVGNPHPFYQ